MQDAHRTRNRRSPASAKAVRAAPLGGISSVPAVGLTKLTTTAVARLPHLYTSRARRVAVGECSMQCYPLVLHINCVCCIAGVEVEDLESDRPLAGTVSAGLDDFVEVVMAEPDAGYEPMSTDGDGGQSTEAQSLSQRQAGRRRPTSPVNIEPDHKMGSDGLGPARRPLPWGAVDQPMKFKAPGIGRHGPRR